MKNHQEIKRVLLVITLLAGLYLLPTENAAAATEGNIDVPPQLNVQSDQDTRTYWTPERMKLAQPAPMPTPNEPLKALPPPHSMLRPMGSSGSQPQTNIDQTKE